MYQIDYVGAVRRRWWIVLAVACVAGLIGFMLPSGSTTSAANSKQPPVSTWNFRAETLVGANGEPGVTGNTGSNAASAPVTPSQIVFYASNEAVLAAAAKAAGFGYVPPSQLVGRMFPYGAGKHQIAAEIGLFSYGPTPGAAAALANAYAAQVGKYLTSLDQTRYAAQKATLQNNIKQLQTQLSLLQVGKPTGAQVAQAAAINARLTTENVALTQLEQTNPQTGFTVLAPADATSVTRVKGTTSGIPVSGKDRVLIAALIGLLLGIGIALLLEVLDKRIRASSRAEVAFGYPVVAEIPEPPKVGPTAPFELFGPDALPSPQAEAFRMLRMSIMLEGLAPVAYENEGSATPEPAMARRPVEVVSLDADDDYDYEMGRDGRQVVLVTSASTEPSCAMVVTNLAASYGEAGNSVLVMSTHELHNGEVRNDVDHIRVKPSEMEDRLRPTRLDNVATVSLGDFVDSSGELATMAPPIVDEARKLAEIVIIEAPALLGFHDAAAFSPDSDVVLVIGESVVTTVEQAKRTGEMLKRIGAPVLGVVFTNVHIDGRDVRVAVQRTSHAPKPSAPRHGPGAGAPDEAPAVVPAVAAAAEAAIETPPALELDDESIELGGNGNGYANGNGHATGHTNGNGNGHADGYKNGNGNGYANGNGNGVRATPAVTKNP
jgi:Mrp family chromosome partitioning ATPase